MAETREVKTKLNVFISYSRQDIEFVDRLQAALRSRGLVGGCYEMSFKKIGGAWHIAGLTLARAWAEGNLDLPKIAGERARE